MKRRSKEEIASLVVQVKKLVAEGMPATNACKQVGLSPGIWWTRERQMGKYKAKMARKYKKSRKILATIPSMTLLDAPAEKQVFMFFGTVSQVTSVMRSLS